MVISLVLCTVGRDAELRRYVRSLAAQENAAWRLRVVDQNADPTLVAGALAALPAGSKVDVVHRPPGLARARNTGWQGCGTAWIMFPDDDCWYGQPNILRGIAKTLDTLCPPDAGACVFPLCDGVDRPIEDVTFHEGQQQRLRPLLGNGLRTGGIASPGLAFRADGLAAIGGFDERFGVGGLYPADEDMDAMIRLSRAGYTIWGVDRPAIIHLAPQGHRAAQWAKYKVARGALYRKHLWSLETRGWAARDLIRNAKQVLARREPPGRLVSLPLLLARGFLSYATAKRHGTLSAT